MSPFSVPGIPGEIHWKNQPLDWGVSPSGNLDILAGAHTDWFSDPAGEGMRDSAPSALFIPKHANCILSAKVAVEFAASFDAGALQIRGSDELWGKLAIEYSPQGNPMIVSVVTRGRSDDCNSVPIEGHTVHLRMAITPEAIAFHYALDGSYWHFVRHFTLGKLEQFRLGFSAQSPMGQQCRVAFSEIRYQEGRLNELRNGE